MDCCKIALLLCVSIRFHEEQHLNSCHMWFKSYVVRWIKLADTKCKRGIDEAIKSDEV